MQIFCSLTVQAIFIWCQLLRLLLFSVWIFHAIQSFGVICKCVMECKYVIKVSAKTWWKTCKNCRHWYIGLSIADQQKFERWKYRVQKTDQPTKQLQDTPSFLQSWRMISYPCTMAATFGYKIVCRNKKTSNYRCSCIKCSNLYLMNAVWYCFR